MKESLLLDAFRKTTVDIAVDVLRTVHSVKQAVNARQECDPEGDAPPAPGPAQPSVLTMSDFLGEVASLGLDQINGILQLRARYGDELTRWLTDSLMPPPRSPAPRQEITAVVATAGGKTSISMVVTNSLSRRATVSFGHPHFRSSAGAEVPQVRFRLSTPTIELDPGQPWIVVVDIEFISDADDRPMAPGRYVGIIDALVAGRVVHKLVIDLTLEAPGSPS